MSDLPSNIGAWQRSYAEIDNKDFGSANFASGSKFKFENAILLRVLYSKALVCPESLKEWINDRQMFPAARQSQAEAAVMGQHYEPLLRIVKKPSKNWTLDDFINSGSFGPFLSLLALIERNNTDEEEESAVRYVTTPVVARTRLQQPRRDPFVIPIKKSTGQLDFAGTLAGEMDLGMPSTTESAELPLSAEESVSRYERARIKVQDEQTVNQCLINLLLPISWPLGISGNVDPQRKAYIFVLQDTKAYEARVDGVITHPNNKNDILGFLEVKRGHRTNEVRIQEVAQMVAFMYSKNKDPLRIDDNASALQRSWLISMCANELFITIASCNRPWMEFLGTGEGLQEGMPELKPENFLHMKEYGPYLLSNYHGLLAALKHLHILLHPIS
ncbi:7554f834-41a2-479a-b7c4-a9efadbe6754 [Sclerotinia trifoliorum]|uniref:7554f834-41a2-479a-b7c4-a9efadbe6754 n=1 Tax=Sclerotinia trifoliorum TaxID=28548 RepID=A0A8H2W2Z3_9HELO|nr:7554f834-41a2-479a-b7c4-a9efadbe6754 [Sclerotinia trifoliorum]